MEPNVVLIVRIRHVHEDWSEPAQELTLSTGARQAQVESGAVVCILASVRPDVASASWANCSVIRWGCGRPPARKPRCSHQRANVHGQKTAEHGEAGADVRHARRAGRCGLRRGACRQNADRRLARARDRHAAAGRSAAGPDHIPSLSRSRPFRRRRAFHRARQTVPVGSACRVAGVSDGIGWIMPFGVPFCYQQQRATERKEGRNANGLKTREGNQGKWLYSEKAKGKGSLVECENVMRV